MQNGVQAKTARWLFTKSLQTLLMFFAIAAKVSVLVVSNKLMNRLTVNCLQLGLKELTKQIVKKRELLNFGSKQTLNPAQNARLQLRRTKDACTWLVEAADMSFVGYVSAITRITRKTLVSRFVVLGKMFKMPAEVRRFKISPRRKFK